MDKKEALKIFEEKIQSIENPLVRKALQNRKNHFIFSGLFWKEESSSKNHTDYSEHKDYGDYSDYSDYSDHSDTSEPGYWDLTYTPGHTDAWV